MHIRYVSFHTDTLSTHTNMEYLFVLESDCVPLTMTDRTGTGALAPAPPATSPGHVTSGASDVTV